MAGNQQRNSGSGFWSDLGGSVFAWILPIVLVGGTLWLMAGMPDLSKVFGGSDTTSTTTSQSRSFSPEPREQGYIPTDREIEQASRESWQKVTGKEWSCFYDPTMNENWHDDVRCTDGPNSFRPTLLADQGFVTESDMRIAAQDYEHYLNSGGTP